MTRKPTAKQAAFAAAIVEGRTLSEAYLLAGYSPRMNAHAIQTEAARMAARDPVKTLIEQGRRDAAKRASWTLAKAVERLEQVNQKAVEELLEQGITSGRVAAFLGTLDRLNELTDAKPNTNRPLVLLGVRCEAVEAGGGGR